MIDHNAEDSNRIADTRPSGGAGMIIALVVLVFVLFMGALFVSGFWSPKAKHNRSLPHYKVSVTGGNAPAIVLTEKAVSAGDPQVPDGVELDGLRGEENEGRPAW